MRVFKPDASRSLRQNIISVLAKSSPHLLNRDERMRTGDLIDGGPKSKLHDMLRHQLNGGTVDGRSDPIGTPVDLLRGLSPHDQHQLEMADRMMTAAVRGGHEVDVHDFLALYGELSPAAQSRLVEMHEYYGGALEDRMPFEPRISPEQFMRADGHDAQVAGALMGNIDTAQTMAGLYDRMNQSDPEHVKKAREEREHPNAERHDLRESVENSLLAHEVAGTGRSDTLDIREHVDTYQPSLKATISGVARYLDGEG